MGLLNKLIRSGTRAITNAVSDVVYDKVSDVVTDALRGNTSDVKKNVKSAVNSIVDLVSDEKKSDVQSEQQSKTYEEEDNRTFDEKLRAILDSSGEYEIRRNISPDELEQEAGVEIYTRAAGWYKPDTITYGIFKDGQRVLLINLWEEYQSYTHKANHQIRGYCVKNKIKILDFFDYMPNEFGYMEERIRAKLV